jgi:predicted nucleotidyltransferase
MVVNGVKFPMDVVAHICRQYGAQRLSLFGSIMRDDFTSESDVDMLVEFLPQTRIGLIGMANMEADLSQAIGRRVDLRTPGDLSRYFRDEVVSHARLLHAA